MSILLVHLLIQSFVNLIYSYVFKQEIIDDINIPNMFSFIITLSISIIIAWFYSKIKLKIKSKIDKNFI